MPVLGLTMEEGTVAEWLKAEGDPVKKDEPLLTVEMDKGTVEVPAPASGVLARIVVQPGKTVPVKALIAEIEGPTPSPARQELTVSASNRDPRAGAGPGGARLFASPRARMRARAV